MNLGYLERMNQKTLNVNNMEVSNCCGASPYGELDGIYGRCSDCKEHATFHTEE